MAGELAANTFISPLLIALIATERASVCLCSYLAKFDCFFFFFLQSVLFVFLFYFVSAAAGANVSGVFVFSFSFSDGGWASALM